MKNIARLRFAHLPTPIEELPNLTAALGGPRIFVKRDDQTGLAFGGNKTRKLEFLVAEAREQGADMLISARFTVYAGVSMSAACGAVQWRTPQDHT